MRKIWIAGICCLAMVQVRAQADTTKYLSLKEITLNTKQKTADQHLVHFFRANLGFTLEEMMSRLPELSFTRRGPYGMEPMIRSMNGGQINTLLDGMRIYGACTDKMDPATIYIEPANLDNISVKTGNSGSLSGSTVGGTIDLKMAEPQWNKDKRTSVSLTSGYQSAAHSLYESARIDHSYGKLAILATGTYRRNQDYRAGGGEIVEHSQFEKLNYSLSAAYRLSDALVIKADLLGDDGWNIGYPALPMDVGYASARIAAITIASDRSVVQHTIWRAKIYSNKVRHFMDDSHRQDLSMHMDMPGVSNTQGAFGEGEWHLSAKQTIQARADISTTYQQASMTMYAPGQQPMYMLTWPDNRKDQAGASVSWMLKTDSTWNLGLSGRLDMIRYRLTSENAKQEMAVLGFPSANRDDLLKNASLRIDHVLGRYYKANFSMSYAERVPTSSELYGYYLYNRQDNHDYIGNPALKNEQSFQSEASVSYTRSNTRLQATGFINRIHHYIFGQQDSSLSTMTEGSEGVKKYVNLPYATLLGFEASAMVKTGKHLQLVSTIRYTLGENDKKQPLPMIPPLKNITSMRYLAGKLSTQLEFEGASRQQRIDPVYGEDETAGYYLIHCRFSYSLNISKTPVVIQSGVENLLDRKYHEHLDWGNIPRQGRNFYLQVRLTL